MDNLNAATKSFMQSFIKDPVAYVPDFKYLKKVGAVVTIRIRVASLLEKHLRAEGFKIKTINDYGTTDIVVLDSRSSVVLTKINFNSSFTKVTVK